MKAHVIDTGRFKLDGGAMFGVVPRPLWERLTTPDENNLCTWAMRCLLVETDNRRILFDTGIGSKQDDKFRSHFQPNIIGLSEALAEKGVSVNDITDVFLTHLHFDHVGGALRREPSGEIVPTFPNATYWTTRTHLDWALNPNPRERASFLKENIEPLVSNKVLSFIDPHNPEWIEGIQILFAYGHTEAMMIPHIPINGKTLVFCADLLPSSFHVRMPYVMSYDIRPLETLKEKKLFFDAAIKGEYILFLEHDPSTDCITLKQNERGRYDIAERLTLNEAINHPV